MEKNFKNRYNCPAHHALSDKFALPTYAQLREIELSGGSAPSASGRTKSIWIDLSAKAMASVRG